MGSFVPPWKKTKSISETSTIDESDPLVAEQNDIGDHVSVFNAWLAGAWRKGSRASADAGDQNCSFVPFGPLKEFFERDDNISKICQDLYKSKPWPDGFEPDSILDDGYLLVFAILLHIGRGPLIARFVTWDDLRDEKLPFDQRPTNFPRISNDNGDKLFKEFCRWQNSFKVPDLKYKPMFNHAADRILPYRLIEPLGSGHGHTADVWKIEVEPGYNRLETRSPRNRTQVSGLQNVYVLKVFKTKWAETDWKQELNAFLNLGRDGRTENNLIACFGSFRHGESVSLILEYADRNTLEDLFSEEQPGSATDVWDFWAALLDLTKALQHLHGNSNLRERFGHKLMGNASYKGVHQDVKPQNILVFTRPNGSRFQLVFKLADLGSSHFKPKMKPSTTFARLRSSSIGRGQRGTRTYGPPELYMPDSMTSRVVDDPSIADVWSLGTIYSEAATWAILGTSGLNQYRSRLEQETRALGIDDVGCFHNGQEVLPAVLKQHQLLLEQKDEEDTITQPVLEIVERMLYQEYCRIHAAVARMDAKQALRRAGNGTRTAPLSPQDERGRSLQVEWPSTPSRETPISELRAPPLPPRAHSQNAPDVGTSSMQPSNTVSRGDNVKYLPPVSGPPRRRATTATPEIIIKAPEAPKDPPVKGLSIRRRPVVSSPTFTPSSPPLLSPSDIPLSTPPAASASSSKGEKGRGTIRERMRRYSTPQSRRKSREQSPQPELDSPESVLKAQPVQLSRADQDSASDDSDPRTSAESALASGYFPPLDRSMRDSSSSDKTRLIASAQTQPLLLPFWKAKKAITWNRRRKQKKKDHPRSPFKKPESGSEGIPFYYERSHLLDRKIVFLVDTAGIMEPHWDDVIALLGVLSYLLKPADTDGLDIHFTQSRDGKPLKPKTFKKTTLLVQWLEENRPPYNHNHAADVGKMLSKLLDRYREALKDKQKWLGAAKQSWAPLKRTIVYVITDGRWQQPEGAQLALKYLTDKLHELNEPEDQFGVQFIQYGNAPSGAETLKRYDMCEGLQRDIVDCEHASGNIWKMLLGSINRRYDSDEEHDEEESEPEAEAEAPPVNIQGTKKGKEERLLDDYHNDGDDNGHESDDNNDADGGEDYVTPGTTPPA